MRIRRKGSVPCEVVKSKIIWVGEYMGYSPVSTLAMVYMKELATLPNKSTITITIPNPRKGLYSMRIRHSSYVRDRGLGRMAPSTFEPSSGGIGIRFKNPSHRFAKTPMKQMEAKSGSPHARVSPANISASAKFVAGPAAATNASPHVFIRTTLKGL